MKKSICFILVIMSLVGCLTACNFTTNIQGGSKDNAESTPKVEEMMSAITEDRVSDAKSLLHPRASEKTDDAIEQMVNFIKGRSVSALELININISTSTGTSGKMRQEQVAYRVTLNDGEIIYLNAVYVTADDGNGFASFQLVLGVV